MGVKGLVSIRSFKMVTANADSGRMEAGRNWPKMLLAVSMVAALLMAAAPALAAEVDYSDVPTYELTFPLVGGSYYSDTFDACRSGCSRTHGATDIMTYGYKGVPIVAAHAGEIVMTSTSVGRACCAIWGLRAADGWETWYIHMNNDDPYTDNGAGEGFAPGIANGVWVEEGQLIGWVGDSGNAEWISPHLHFELRMPDGTRVNPYPSLQAAKRTFYDRVAGPNRFDTAALISQQAYPNGADVAFVATGYDFPDALAGGPASVKAGGPVLLASATGVPGATVAELQRLAPSVIYLLGGEAVLQASVAAQLAGLAPSVIRLAGPDRAATAAAISAEFFEPDVDVVYVANGTGYADAVAGAPAAAREGSPLLLVDRDEIPEATAVDLLRLRPSAVVVLGGSGVVADSVAAELGEYAQSGTVIRLAGGNRFSTAAAIAQRTHPGGAAKVYLATGTGFVDALAGISIAVADDAPILLVDDTLPGATAAELARLGASDLVVIGGLSVVPDTVEAGLWSFFNDNSMPLWR